MTNEQEPLTHEKVVAQFALQYAVRLRHDAPNIKRSAMRSKYAEKAFVQVVMYFHPEFCSSVEWAIEYVHVCYVSHLATWTDRYATVPPKEQARIDAYTEVYNIFCTLYPRREKVTAAAH